MELQLKIISVSPLTAYDAGRGFYFKKGSYIMRVSKYVKVTRNGYEYNVDISATHKTLQKVIDLKVGDVIPCVTKRNLFGQEFFELSNTFYKC